MKAEIRIIVVLILLAIAGTAQTQEPSREDQIERAIQHMMDGVGHKVVMQPRVDAVAAFGDEAVPSLIKTFQKTEDEKCWPLIECLCAIGTAASLAFAKQVLEEPTKLWSASAVIRRFPVLREDEITSLLIASVRVRKLELDSSERLKKMIDRKPERAGQLIGALKDDGSNDAYDRQLGGIVAFVSGYSNLWAVLVPPRNEVVKITNAWWRGWWNRNKNRDVFGWLEAALSANREEHKATVLQRMWAIKDKRALPYFLEALDSPAPSVQYWGITGLQSLDGTFEGKQLPYAGITHETFLKEKDGLIAELKKKFKTGEARELQQPATESKH